MSDVRILNIRFHFYKYLENHFVFDLCSAGGFPLEDTSELVYQYNKGIIYGINCVILLYIFYLFL
jgi:hypothetical protein